MGVRFMKSQQKHDGSHLTLEERKIIQAGIQNGATKADIARTIGKDATTVAKEIRKHREIKPRSVFNRPVLCAKRELCRVLCLQKCEDYEDPACNRRDKSPGACNGCADAKKCVMDKYIYDAAYADQEYQRDLVDYREGINLTTKERDAIGGIIAPLLKQGQSVHQILSAHPEITQCEKTIYTYIESGVFKNVGVDNFSLKEQVNRRQFKNKYKKRTEKANYEGRRYSDYLHFRAENPEIPAVEMDTVYNDPKGPYLQTFLFEKTSFMVGIIHQNKTCVSMARGVDSLQSQLSSELFSLLCALFLTDRGSEFEMYRLFEFGKDGSSRLKIFYCDPMQSSQKPHVENNHNYIRDIIPNGYPLDNVSQDDVNLMFSHINSAPRKALGDKSPYEVFSFLYGSSVPKRLNISYVERDNVTLKPQLIYAKQHKTSI